MASEICDRLYCAFGMPPWTSVEAFIGGDFTSVKFGCLLAFYERFTLDTFHRHKAHFAPSTWDRKSAQFYVKDVLRVYRRVHGERVYAYDVHVKYVCTKTCYTRAAPKDLPSNWSLKEKWTPLSNNTLGVGLYHWHSIAAQRQLATVNRVVQVCNFVYFSI